MTDTIEIRGGTLIDGTGGPPVADATVQVAGGVIRAVWRGPDRPSGSAGAGEILDARGKTVLPGLIDAHCHLSYGEGRSAEEIDVYGGAEWSAVRAVHNARKVLRAGVTGVCDPGSTWNVAVTVREVRRQVKNRVDLIKISGDSEAQEARPDVGPVFSDDELGLIVTEAHRLGRKATIHARYAPTVRAALRAGVDWIIHASYLGPEDIGPVRDAGVPLCPTLTLTANIVEWGAEVGVSPSYIEVKKRELDVLVATCQRAYGAGIRLMAGSEAGFSVMPYGEWHARELELLVKLVGLRPMDALLAATRDNAAILGWSDSGTVEPGRRADLLVVDGDPLSDLGVLGDRARRSAVFKDGRRVDLGDVEPPRRRMRHERGFGVSERPLHRGEPTGGR